MGSSYTTVKTEGNCPCGFKDDGLLINHLTKQLLRFRHHSYVPSRRSMDTSYNDIDPINLSSNEEHKKMELNDKGIDVHDCY